MPVGADVLPDAKRNVAILFTRGQWGSLRMEGAGLWSASIVGYGGTGPGFAAGAALIARLQKDPARLAPMSLNQFAMPGLTDLVLAPGNRRHSGRRWRVVNT